MFGRTSGPVTLLCLAMVFVMATFTGLTTGMQANSVADARIVEGEDYNATVDASDRDRNATAVPLPDVVTDPITRTSDGIGDAINGTLLGDVNHAVTMTVRTGTERFAEGTIRLSMGWADRVAVFAYHNRWWIHEWWVQPLFALFGVGFAVVTLGYTVVVARRVPQA